MPSKAEIKSVAKLKQKKYRKESGLFVVEGIKLVNEMAKTGLKVHKLFVTHEQAPHFKWHESVDKVTSAEMRQMSTMTTPPGVLAVVQLPEKKPSTTADGILLVDAVSDPGNLGTLLRTADWFGIKTVILGKNSTDAYSHKAVQASMGSLFRVNVIYADLVKSIGELKMNGTTVFGAVLTGKNIYSYTFPKSFALLLGSESHGIDPDLLSKCDEHITIPSFGNAESLNVAVSGAVILGEIKRQLTFKVQ